MGNKINLFEGVTLKRYRKNVYRTFHVRFTVESPDFEGRRSLDLTLYGVRSRVKVTADAIRQVWHEWVDHNPEERSNLRVIGCRVEEHQPVMTQVENIWSDSEDE